MTEKDLLEATKQLIAIESTAENPAGLQAAYEQIRQMIWDSGKAIAIEEFDSNGKPSLLAYREGDRPERFRIILNGHLDIVPGRPEQYLPKIKDGKLYGRGVYDMKAAAVIMTAIFCEFVDKLPYPLALQITTDEEVGGKDGTGTQVRQGVIGDFVICGECGRTSDVHEVANEAKGIAVVNIGFRGNSAHGAYPWRGDNAALKAARFAQAIHDRYPTPTDATGETTVTITAIDAVGEAHTKIPDTATVRIDGRFTHDDPDFHSIATFEKMLETIDPDCTITEVISFFPPVYTAPDSPLLLELKAAAEHIEGAEFSLVKRNGTSDARYYDGSEACEFGIAGEHQHADDEHITLEAFRNYLMTMREFLQRTATA
ncbi:MAG TPA: M20/M25/M40 family metallo-hydrolase [Candidatus Saccharimonadales bacterium]|nr:M20/M25/M40 family metallo-hydrolase [Candidatus Saccharimonadales bacterium]